MESVEESEEVVEEKVVEVRLGQGIGNQNYRTLGKDTNFTICYYGLKFIFIQ